MLLTLISRFQRWGTSTGLTWPLAQAISLRAFGAETNSFREVIPGFTPGAINCRRFAAL